ncbi:MAG: class I SAM-dependent methyltransferase [Phycisphaeraceae bacterium]|nr:class I SAM-dependent methyltransferase [Phycisphaeraceae bacterium]
MAESTPTFLPPSFSKYDRDGQLYKELVDQIYARYPHGVTLTPEYAQFVEENLLRFTIRLARYKFVARLLRPRDRVLEVGCGSGLGAIFLSQHCRQVTGLDVKEHEINEARMINRRANVSFAAGDFFALDSAQAWDAVVMLDVIEHMDEPLGQKLVAQAGRILAPGGMLVLGTPSLYSYPHQGPLSQASHVKCYDQEELLRLMENYFGRVLPFSMNDEMVHTGNPKMAWYYFMVATAPRRG